MTRCLITGHKGYIGSHLFKMIQDLGHEVLGIDLKDGNNILSSLNTFEYENFKPEYIFHLAANPRVGYSMEHPYEVFHNNIVTSLSVLEFARLHGVKRVIYSSSSSVVGNGYGPTNPYGASKLIPEILCKNYSDVFGVDAVCLRYFNVYSKDQPADGPYATVVSNWMKYIRENRVPFITGDGTQRRDMLHIKDVVAANIFCMNYEENFGGKHFDIGTGNNISLNEMKKIVRKYNPDVEFEYVDSRPGEVATTKANVRSLMSLGFKTEISIKKGLESCFLNVKKK